MTENTKRSILEMARGAFLEKTDLEMSKIIENILDINTKATEKRRLQVTLDFKPDDDRTNVAVSCSVKSSLAAVNPSTTFLYVSDEDHIVEMVPNVPGQMALDGTEQEAPATLKTIKLFG